LKAEPLKLRRHPHSAAGGVESLVAGLRRAGDFLHVDFEIAGEAQQWTIATERSRERRDELWQQTCFELFARSPGASRYREWNLCPNGDWQHYEFADRRSGRASPPYPTPQIAWSCEARHTGGHIARLTARLHWPWHKQEVGVCAIVRDTESRTDYWALAHADGKPDFHAAETFATTLEGRHP
jgi:hypothetical protein